LFTLQSWAPRLTTILWIITAVVGILWMLFVQTPSTVVSGLFYLGAAALIYGYFGKPEIRSLYGS
jgi:lauroyl/myristoyl acyltransferase